MHMQKPYANSNGKQNTTLLTPPFPYFGTKWRAADLIWERLGDVPNFADPFCGTLGVALRRPHPPRREIFNDADGMIVNFWRAVQNAPERVACHAARPRFEADLHAVHLELVQAKPGLTERLIDDRRYYDAELAGLWVWGQCLWIGKGFCSGRLPRSRPQLGDRRGILGKADPIDYLSAIAARIRNAGILCGTWLRALTPTLTTRVGLTGALLDPPYLSAGRDDGIYATDSKSVAHGVWAWAITHGSDARFRIALCGLAGDYEMPRGWDAVLWGGNAGFDGQRKNGTNENRKLEVIWFSPHCLPSGPLTRHCKAHGRRPNIPPIGLQEVRNPTT
jgi:DNA adenine methylase